MAAMVGMFVGAFIVSLLVAVVWLIVAKLIPPLKRNPKAAYGAAMALAVAVQLIQINGVSAQGLLGALACCGLLFLQMKRALASQAAAKD
jgi:uncharacterized membrane protein YagU involved in acid resistance